jgi:hypothetical protein
MILVTRPTGSSGDTNILKHTHEFFSGSAFLILRASSPYTNIARLYLPTSLQTSKFGLLMWSLPPPTRASLWNSQIYGWK